MDLPVHWEVTAALAGGREFTERLAEADKEVRNAEIPVPSPDGSITMYFDGYAGVKDVTFAEDLFETHSVTKIADLLTDISAVGYELAKEAADSRAQTIRDAIGNA